MLNFENIQLFYEMNIKKDNDKNNKIRELIITAIIKNEIPIEWFNDEKWKNLKNQLFLIINIKVLNNFNYTKIDIEYFGGRKYNYDFTIIASDINKKIEKNIEFKYNCNKIDKYPQFLSKNANQLIKSDCYASYFYDNYIKEIGKLFKLDIPNKIDYMKYIYNNDYTKLEFFNNLKLQENLHKNEKNKIVKESIRTYLYDFLELDIDAINDEFKLKQKDKDYLLYKNGLFYYDKISKEELEITKIETIKNNNCLVLGTNSSTKIKMLLRWKNHIGILYPAWQISLYR